jgi:hypothetical protein
VSCTFKASTRARVRVRISRRSTVVRPATSLMDATSLPGGVSRSLLCKGGEYLRRRSSKQRDAPRGKPVASRNPLRSHLAAIVKLQRGKPVASFRFSHIVCEARINNPKDTQVFLASKIVLTDTCPQTYSVPVLRPLRIGFESNEEVQS